MVLDNDGLQPVLWTTNQDKGGNFVFLIDEIKKVLASFIDQIESIRNAIPSYSSELSSIQEQVEKLLVKIDEDN